jgi:hypothetical protein
MTPGLLFSTFLMRLRLCTRQAKLSKLKTMESSMEYFGILMLYGTGGGVLKYFVDVVEIVD